MKHNSEERFELGSNINLNEFAFATADQYSRPNQPTRWSSSPLNVRELFPFDVDDLLYSKFEELCMLIRHCDVVQEA